MTSFLDGPAKGQALMLKRAPIYLRVVQGKDGQWDALDQLTDVPHVDERIVVYRRDGEPGWVHIRARKGGGFFTRAEYRAVETAPADDEVRDTAAWRAWVSVQIGKPVNDDGTVD